MEKLSDVEGQRLRALTAQAQELAQSRGYSEPVVVGVAAQAVSGHGYRLRDGSGGRVDIPRAVLQVHDDVSRGMVAHETAHIILGDSHEASKAEWSVRGRRLRGLAIAGVSGGLILAGAALTFGGGAVGAEVPVGAGVVTGVTAWCAAFHDEAGIQRPQEIRADRTAVELIGPKPVLAWLTWEVKRRKDRGAHFVKRVLGVLFGNSHPPLEERIAAVEAMAPKPLAASDGVAGPAAAPAEPSPLVLPEAHAPRTGAVRPGANRTVRGWGQRGPVALGRSGWRRGGREGGSPGR